jgi:hypothetical protein
LISIQPKQVFNTRIKPFMVRFFRGCLPCIFNIFLTKCK